MAYQQITSLSETRDELLREFMLASGLHKAEILAKIIDLDEELEKQKN
ncbi:MAG: hypothetical protein SCK29_02450 [Bacillota bacterium]|nr:hypothetical protein [Bacillota bacterium]MDW7682963.1 hypothetical protein [Bacillota bacterium]